jgi:hypothetical protein
MVVTVTKKQEAKFETAEMKLSRSVVGYTRKDQVRSTEIREELDICNLNNKVLKSRSGWKYHFLQVEDSQIPKKILTYNLIRRQNIGHPQLRRRDQHSLQED